MTGAAIVTGSASGIGLACMRAFAEAGYGVVGVDLRDADVTGDVSQRGTNERAVALALERFGRLDAAIGNAGVTLARLIDDTTDEELERLWSVNVRGLVHLAQAAHAALAESRGSL